MIQNYFVKDELKFAGAMSEVEWLYCFDVHCNAFLPVFLVCYVVQYFLLPVLLFDSFLSILISALLNTAAVRVLGC